MDDRPLLILNTTGAPVMASENNTLVNPTCRDKKVDSMLQCSQYSKIEKKTSKFILGGLNFKLVP